MTNPTPEAETGGELEKHISKTMGWWIDDDAESFDFYPERTEKVIALIAAHTSRAVLLGRLEEIQEAAAHYKNNSIYLNNRVKALEAELKELEA